MRTRKERQVKETWEVAIRTREGREVEDTRDITLRIIKETMDRRKARSNSKNQEREMA